MEPSLANTKWPWVCQLHNPSFTSLFTDKFTSAATTSLDDSGDCARACGIGPVYERWSRHHPSLGSHGYVNCINPSFISLFIDTFSAAATLFDGGGDCPRACGIGSAYECWSRYHSGPPYYATATIDSYTADSIIHPGQYIPRYVEFLDCMRMITNIPLQTPLLRMRGWIGEMMMIRAGLFYWHDGCCPGSLYDSISICSIVCLDFFTSFFVSLSQ